MTVQYRHIIVTIFLVLVNNYNNLYSFLLNKQEVAENNPFLRLL